MGSVVLNFNKVRGINYSVGTDVMATEASSLSAALDRSIFECEQQAKHIERQELTLNKVHQKLAQLKSEVRSELKNLRVKAFNFLRNVFAASSRNVQGRFDTEKDFKDFKFLKMPPKEENNVGGCIEEKEENVLRSFTENKQIKETTI